MDWLAHLRVALEASVTTQLALFAGFVIARADWLKPTGFFLGAICASVATALLLNVAASAGLSALHTLNYFIDLSLGPLLLGLAARAGSAGPPIHRGDAVHLTGLALGLAALISGWPPAPDAVAALSIWSYLAAALITIWRRRGELKQTRLFDLVRGVASVMAITAVMRVWMSFDAESGRVYRDSAAYITVLIAAFAMAGQILWLALRQPKVFATPKNDSDAPHLEAAFARLVDGEQLFLKPQLTLAEVAKRLRTSSRSVSRMIATRFGENFSAYVNRRRAEEAAAALIESTKPITTIMYDAGFGSKSAFQREFVKRYGISPSEYRRRHDSSSTSQYK